MANQEGTPEEQTRDYEAEFLRTSKEVGRFANNAVERERAFIMTNAVLDAYLDESRSAQSEAA